MLFITLGQLISQNTSIQTLISAIRKDGICTFDAVDHPCQADKDDLQIVSDLLVDQYNFNKDYDAYVQRTGTPLSPLERCEEGPQNAEEAEGWVNPYDLFGWPKNNLPNFDEIEKSIATNLAIATGETPAEQRAALDITTMRGCPRLILECWDTVEMLHGPGADGRQVLKIIKRNLGKFDSEPTLKTIQNTLIKLRLKKFIP